jgi:hypothetical protein
VARAFVPAVETHTQFVTTVENDAELPSGVLIAHFREDPDE